ncbi:MAG: rhomboid family intramembrane serine protease [bacterium]
MPRLTRAVRALLIANIALYIVQLVVGTVFNWHGIEPFFGLSPAGVVHGCLWQFVSYMFLHDTGSILHIVMNMFGLFFMGPDVEREIGLKKFLLLYFGSGILGGVGWILLTLKSGALCIGASGAVFGVLGAFGALFPRRQVTLLLFFVLPLTMTARMLAASYGLVSLVMMLQSQSGGIAHAAHLAGGLAGYLYASRMARGNAYGLYDYSSQEVTGRPGWISGLMDRIRTARKKQREPDEGEVNRILEKVAEKGLNSITRKERDTLDRASRLR